jgi:uncharacterized lipoprotein YmbA
MTTTTRANWWRPLTVCLLVAALSGCFGSGRTIEFYTLAPLPRPAAGPGGAPGTIVAVYPAVIPAAIDRPQIVTRTDENLVVLSEFNRWGGTLKDEISRTLIENLNILLAERRVNVMGDSLALDPQYFVAVTFNRFDGRLGESVWLNAAWAVRDQKGRKTLALKTSILQEKVSGPGYADLVAAQSRALGTLSREIATELAAMIKTP